MASVPVQAPALDQPNLPRHGREGQEAHAAPVSIWLVLGLAAAGRFPLLFLTQGTDYWFYLGLGKLSNLGFYPYLHYWLEYPPVFPWLAVAVYRLTLTFPPTLFSSFTITHHLLLGGILVAAELGIVALVYAIGRDLGGREDALRRTMVYAALLWPVAVAIGWYDSLPALLLFLGLYLILRGRGLSAGAVAGFGFMTKIFPVVLVPVAVKFLPGWRHRARVPAGAALTTLAIAAPLLWLSPTYFLASYRATFSRSAWETVWALLDGYYSYGKIVPLGVRFDPDTAGYVAYPSRVPGLLVAAVFAVLYAALWLRPVAHTPRNIVLFTALSTDLFLLYSKGYSPQFILYILPFVLILLPWRRALGYAALLSAVNFLEWPIYHEWLGEIHWVLGVAVIARTALWLALGGEWLAELWSLRNPLLQISRRAIIVAATVLTLLSCAGGAAAWQAWTQVYYNGDKLRPAYDFIRRYDSGQDRALIFTTDDLYERFAPFFGNDTDFTLLRPQYSEGITLKEPSLSPEGRRETLAALAATHGQLFLVRDVNDWTSRDLNLWLKEHARFDGALRVEQVDISVWQVERGDRPTPQPPQP